MPIFGVQYIIISPAFLDPPIDATQTPPRIPPGLHPLRQPSRCGTCCVWKRNSVSSGGSVGPLMAFGPRNMGKTDYVQHPWNFTGTSGRCFFYYQYDIPKLMWK